MTLKLSFGTTLALDVVLTVLHAVAIGSTMFRVCRRTRTRRLWWDDFVAAFSMLADSVYICLLWMAYSGPGSLLQTPVSLVAQYWLSSMFFFLVIWTARASLALTIARIFPPRDPTRRFAIGMASLSTVLCLVAIVQSAAICSKRVARSPTPGCQWPTGLRAVVIVGSIFCDGCLVITPLYKLWRVRLPRNQRRLILICFTASALTTTATVACSIFQFAPASWEPAKSVLRGKINYLESGIALMVCNFLVVVTSLYRLFRRGEDLDVPAADAPAPQVDSSASVRTASPDTRASCSTRYTLTEVIETAYASVDQTHGIASTTYHGTGI